MDDKQDNLRHQLSHCSGPAAKWLRLLLFAIFLIHIIEETSLARNTSISGQVSDAESGTLLVDVHVSLLRDAERASLFRTSRTGQFRFDDIVQGDIYAAIRAGWL